METIVFYWKEICLKKEKEIQKSTVLLFLARCVHTTVRMWKFQSHFATNWKQIRILPRGNVVKLGAGANEERGESIVKSWQIYSAQGNKRVLDENEYALL